MKLPKQFDPAAIFEEFFERVSRCFPFRLCGPKEAIMVPIVIGALLFVGGSSFMAGTAIFRQAGKMQRLS